MIDSDGKPVGRRRPHVADRRQDAGDPARDGLPGDYTVRWEIVATDGHLESGVFAFGVGTGRPPPQAASFSGSDQDWRYLLARAAYFAGLLLLIGGVVYRVAGVRAGAASEPAEARSMMSLRERHRANQVLAESAVLTLAGGWVALTSRERRRRGQLLGGVRPPRPGRLGARVHPVRPRVRPRHRRHRGLHRPGRARLRRRAARPADRARRCSASRRWCPGVWALAVPGLSGHAGDPGRGLLAVALDVVHVGAAAIWAGGLLQLAWVDAPRDPGPAGRARARGPDRDRPPVLEDRAGQRDRGRRQRRRPRALYEFAGVSEVWTPATARR